MEIDPQRQVQLERLLDQELKKLPDRKTPPVVLQKTMAVLRARARQPWWQQPWIAWPLPAKLAACFLVLGIIGALSTPPWSGFGGAAVRVQQHFSLISTVIDAAGTLLRSAGLLVGTVPPLLLWGLAAVVAGMYAAFLGIGTALYRVAYTK